MKLAGKKPRAKHKESLEKIRPKVREAVEQYYVVAILFGWLRMLLNFSGYSLVESHIFGNARKGVVATSKNKENQSLTKTKLLFHLNNSTTLKKPQSREHRTHANRKICESGKKHSTAGSRA